MAGLLVVAALIYLHRLGDSPVHVSTDEAKLAAQAHALATTGSDMRGNRFPLFVLIVDPLLPQEHSVAWWQPALFYTTAAVYKVAGVSEWTTRLPVVLLSIVNVWLAYLVAARWLGSRWLGVCAALVLAFTPSHFILGREAADYFCPTTVCLVWLLSLGRLMDQPTPGRAVITGSVLGLGLYSYITSWVVMPTYLALTVLACWRLRYPVTLIGRIVAAFAICGVPAVIFVALHPAMFGEVADHYKVSGASRTIQRITKTMQMIATAKFTAARARAKATRPDTDRSRGRGGEGAGAAGEEGAEDVDEQVDVLPGGSALGQVCHRPVVLDLQIKDVTAMRPGGFQAFQHIPQRVDQNRLGTVLTSFPHATPRDKPRE